MYMNIDIETYSEIDLPSAGVHAYAQDPSFEVLLFTYLYDKELITLTGEELLANTDVIEMLYDPKVTKTAWNASFEITCLSSYLGKQLDSSQWRCTMVQARALDLPGRLGMCAKVLGVEEKKAGIQLIKYFSMPCRPTKKNGGRTRNLPEHDPEAWQEYIDYNRQDVRTEAAILAALSQAPIPEEEQALWIVDQEINGRGVLLDHVLIDEALKTSESLTEKLTCEARELTGLDNPNSPAQIKQYIEDKEGITVASISKAEVAKLLESDISDSTRRLLEIRQQLGKSSVAKYTAMKAASCPDGRSRGLLQFYGASRTGRWAGRRVQVQNLPRNNMEGLAQARELLRYGNGESLDLIYENAQDVLSQLVRTAFIAKPGHVFHVADFSAIEARVLAWIAGEDWRIEAFNKGRDIYCETASRMFGVPVEPHGVNGHLRSKGKVAELACIAKGEKVLTHVGLAPIEDVTTKHKVWDGNNWVTHSGVIYKGIRGTMYYAGLKATPEHLVWVRGKKEPIRLWDAQHDERRLERTEANGKPLQYGRWSRKGRRRCFTFTKNHVYDIMNCGPNNRFTVSGVLVHNCGYGGSVGALKAMGAEREGLSEGELMGMVDSWRNASPRITQYWRDINDAALRAMQSNKPVNMQYGTSFYHHDGRLKLGLPSGRALTFNEPAIGEGRWGQDALFFSTLHQASWVREQTYGGKLTENMVQATARDCLAEALMRLERYKVVMHVHDEVVIEHPADDEGALDRILEILAQPIDWAPGLKLEAEGFTCSYYQKD